MKRDKRHSKRRPKSKRENNGNAQKTRKLSRKPAKLNYDSNCVQEAFVFVSELRAMQDHILFKECKGLSRPVARIIDALGSRLRGMLDPKVFEGIPFSKQLVEIVDEVTLTKRLEFAKAQIDAARVRGYHTTRRLRIG